MDSIKQYNEEQFQMLCLAITDTSSGICLFHCDDAKEQVSVAQRVSNAIAKSCIVIDMSKLEVDKMPDEIGKLRKLLSGKESVQVVILCNLQLCGEAKGDEKYIEKINYMRDQMMVMKKVWVLGMSKYYAVMLSRKARDLYSCIMNHFEFKEEEKESLFEFTEIELLGNKKISLLKFKELQERIKRNGLNETNAETLLQVIAEWNTIYECCNRDTNKWIQQVVITVEKHMMQMHFQPNDCISYQEIARAWLHLENYGRALDIAKLIEEKAIKLLPENGKDIADIYKLLGNIYFRLQQYDKAENYVKNAFGYYSVNTTGISYAKVDLTNILAQIKASKGEGEEAIRMHEQMIQDVEENWGERYFYLIALWNNKGLVHARMHKYSKALKCFLKANELSSYNSEYVGWRQSILKHVGITYGMLGDHKQAINFLKEAENLAERLDSSLISIERKQSIYKLLKKYYKEDLKEDLAEEYTMKLRELEKEL